MAGNNGKKLSDEERREIVYKRLVELESTKDLAEEYGVSQRTIQAIMNDIPTLEAVSARVRAARLRAIIKAESASEEAVDTQIDLMRKDYERESNMFLKQNAARDLMDRANIRSDKGAENNSINIVFASGSMPEVNMPDASTGNQEAAGTEEHSDVTGDA